LFVLFYAQSHSSKTIKSEGLRFDQAVAALLSAVSAPLREPVKGLRLAPKRLLSNDRKANGGAANNLTKTNPGAISLTVIFLGEAAQPGSI